MKTIEEGCVEFCEKLNSVYDEKQVFKAGVEYAQKWIDVKDELPNIGNVVLLKFDDDYTQISTGIYNGSEFIDDFGFNEEKCTHWRPIEYK